MALRPHTTAEQRHLIGLAIDQRRRCLIRHEPRPGTALPSWAMPVVPVPRSKLSVARVEVLRMLLAGGLTPAAVSRAAWEPWGFASAGSLAVVISRRQDEGELPPTLRDDRIPEFSRKQADRLIRACGCSKRPDSHRNGASRAA